MTSKYKAILSGEFPTVEGNMLAWERRYDDFARDYGYPTGLARTDAMNILLAVMATQDQGRQSAFDLIMGNYTEAIRALREMNDFTWDWEDLPPGGIAE